MIFSFIVPSIIRASRGTDQGGARPALQTPTCCVLGLVLLGEGEALRPGRLRGVRRRDDLVRRGAGRGQGAGRGGGREGPGRDVRGAAAASSFGRNEDRAFWRVHRRTLLEARRPGGTFAVQPWKDPGYTGRNDSRPREAKGTTWPGRMYGETWATAWTPLAWQAARG
jgi:hypothetical protein